MTTVGSGLSRRSSRTVTPSLRGLAPQLTQRNDAAHRVEHQRDHEHDDAGPERLQRQRVEQRAHALPDRQRAADDEHADRGEQRPVVALGAVAERVRLVGGLRGAPQRNHQQHLVAGVGDRVQRLGEQRRRAGQRRRGALGDRDRRVRRERGEDAAGALVARGVETRRRLRGSHWCTRARSRAPAAHRSTRPA